MKDSKGKPIAAGSYLVWSDHGQERCGRVVFSPTYTGGLQVGGISVKYMIDNFDWVRAVDID